jgi:hypothetical protein
MMSRAKPLRGTGAPAARGAGAMIIGSTPVLVAHLTPVILISDNTYKSRLR